MRVIDISFKSPLQNIQYDEELLNLAENSGVQPILRFWESDTYFVSLGCIDKEEDAIHKSACENDNVLVIKRSSGGGTVLLGPGCLVYALILPKERVFFDVRKSYHYILSIVCDSLRTLGYPAEIKDIFDIAVENRKISGNAQLRKRKYFLHHGTLLYNFNLDMVGKYLKEPQKQPSYRKNRSHKEFLYSLNVSSGQTLKKVLTEGFENSIKNVWLFNLY